MRGRLILLIVLVFALSACSHPPRETSPVSVPVDTIVQIKVFGNAPRYKTWTAGSIWNNWSCCSRTISEAAFRGLTDLGYDTDTLEIVQVDSGIKERAEQTAFTLVSLKEKKQ